MINFWTIGGFSLTILFGFASIPAFRMYSRTGMKSLLFRGLSSLLVAFFIFGMTILLMVDYFESRPAHEVNATVVHEAVHAMQDVYNNDADVGHLESAAHLAQAVWLLRQGRSLYGRLEREAIADVANAISERADRQGYVRSFVSDSEYQGTRETLSPPYRISDSITMSGDIL